MSRKGISRVVLVLLLTTACGCGKQRLTPVVAGTGAWEKTVRFEVLRARFNIKSPDSFFRDDGLYSGDISIHTQELETELAPRSIDTIGKAIEGLVTTGKRRDGKKVTVIYGRAAGGDKLNRARHESLRAAAAIELGMREGLEQYFASVDIKLQFKTLSDRALIKLVEAYALAKLDVPFNGIKDPETREMAQLLLERGVGRTGRRPIGTRHWSKRW
jgi:hypothetical protein